MSAAFSTENWPVARHQALAGTSPIAVMGGAGKYGFAVLTEDEWLVKTFDDRASRDTALARIFTQRDRWGYPLSWESVFAFEPDRPIRFTVTIEADDAEVES